MAYSETLADRIREKIFYFKKIEEKKMMGGLCFLFKGKMCFGIVKDDLMVRVIEKRYEEALSNPHGREMDFTGRPLKGFVFVSPEGFKKDRDLKYWLDMGTEFVESLPAKAFVKKPITKKSSKKVTPKSRKKISAKKKK